MYTDFDYIGKADGIEYAIEQEAIKANPDNYWEWDIGRKSM